MDNRDVTAFFHCFDHGQGKRVLKYLRDEAESASVDPNDPNPLVALMAHAKLQQINLIESILKDWRHNVDNNEDQ